MDLESPLRPLFSCAYQHSLASNIHATMHYLEVYEGAYGIQTSSSPKERIPLDDNEVTIHLDTGERITVRMRDFNIMAEPADNMIGLKVLRIEYKTERMTWIHLCTPDFGWTQDKRITKSVTHEP